MKPEHGSAPASDAWTAAVYDELRALAAKFFRIQAPFHTLQPTALVHEAWIRMSRRGEGSWESAAHFRNVAALAMRQVLADHARRRAAGKRAAGPRVPLTQLEESPQPREVLYVELLDAIERLAELNERQAHVVVLRFFGGLTVSEVARALDLSKRSVESDWTMARAWLLAELADSMGKVP